MCVEGSVHFCSPGSQWRQNSFWQGQQAAHPESPLDPSWDSVNLHFLSSVSLFSGEHCFSTWKFVASCIEVGY